MILQDPQNGLRLSVISLVEIAIKHQKGKLSLAVSEASLVNEAKKFGVRLLPLLPAHTTAFRDQAFEHPDPFDRLLLATAIGGPMYFLTADKKLHGLSELVVAVQPAAK